jgi:hypothetical protein
MTTTDTEHTEQTTTATPAPGTVVQVWLHLTTGAAGTSEIWDHAGGPAAGKGIRLLEPDRPEPFDGGPWSAHTLADVEAALARHGARVITRGEAARRLTAAGYRLSLNRSFGHVLYADEADDITWRTRHRYTELAFAVYRDERVS